MNLSVFHRHLLPNRNYVPKDKLNRLTGHLECKLLEWTGWYNQDIYQRLLGHYRLYQLFIKENKNNISVPCQLAYILNYRASHNFKYLLSRITGFLYYMGSLGKPYYALQTELINKLLIGEYAHILYIFLTEAERNFEKAVTQAVEKIRSLDFAKQPAGLLRQSAIIFKTRNEFNNYSNSTHYFNEYSSIIGKVGIKGKEKGVFSKKQILILFDLLAEKGNLERIDFTKPNKFYSIALLLSAITGKSQNSWIEQLKHGRSNGLYHFTNEAEKKQLISTLTNLSELFVNGGFRHIFRLVEKKIDEIKRMK